eukprot:gene24032-biopygen23871
MVPEVSRENNAFSVRATIVHHGAGPDSGHTVTPAKHGSTTGTVLPWGGAPLPGTLCSLLFRTVPCCSVLFRTVPCCSVLFRAVPCCSVLFRAVPCCSVLFRAVPCSNPEKPEQSGTSGNFGKARNSTEQHGTARNSTEQHGTVQNSTETWKAD